MKQTRTQDISIKTQTGSEPAREAAVRRFRRGRAFGGGLLPKAGVLAVLLGFPLGASLLTAGEKPHQPQYRFTEIALPGSQALGINNNGLVTGSYTDPVTGDYLSFLFERGVVTTGIAGPGAVDTILGGANNRGVEIGNYGDYTDQQAVMYDVHRGTYTLLPAIQDMTLNFGNGINDPGQAVGTAYAGGDVSNGGTGLGLNWIWDGRHYSFFTVPGAVNGAWSQGLNNRGQVCGWYFGSQGDHGFVKDGPNFTVLDVLGASDTRTFGINNNGVVAGAYAGADHLPHGAIWFGGKAVTVDVPIAGAIATEWYYVNDHGDLAGVYFDTNFEGHAVIAERLDGNGD